MKNDSTTLSLLIYDVMMKNNQLVNYVTLSTRTPLDQKHLHRSRLGALRHHVEEINNGFTQLSENLSFLR